MKANMQSICGQIQFITSYILPTLNILLVTVYNRWQLNDHKLQPSPCSNAHYNAGLDLVSTKKPETRHLETKVKTKT